MQQIAPLSALGRTVAQWQREMIQEGHLSPGTVGKYAANLNALAGHAGARGFTDWRELDRSTVLAYVAAGEAAASTRRNRLLAQRAFFVWAGLFDPSAGMRLAKRDETIPDALTEGEVRAMLAACDDSTWFGVRDRSILELAYSTGARNAEIRGLSLHDLRLEESSVRLMGKGRRERVAYLTESCVAAIRAWLEARTALGVDEAPAPLFVSRLLRDLTDMGLWQVFERRSRLAGIRRVHPHLMRHTFATHMLRNRADVRAIQQLMGHRSLNTTAAYLKADDEWCRSEHRNSHPLNRAMEGSASASNEALSLGRMRSAPRRRKGRAAVPGAPQAGAAEPSAAVAVEGAAAGEGTAQAGTRSGPRRRS